MAKLYPPQIEGTIPAFCQSSSANETYITVPFAMNKAVSWNDFTYFTKATFSNRLLLCINASLFSVKRANKHNKQTENNSEKNQASVKNLVFLEQRRHCRREHG